MGRYDESEQKDKKLFIGGLNYNTDDHSLRKFYSQWGDIVDAVVMRDQSGRSRGFGFVTYSDLAMANKAQSTRPHNIDGRVVDTKFATPREENGGDGASIKKIFVGGLPREVGDDQLRDCFSKYGHIVDSIVMISKETGESRGFGFVTYDTNEAADNAINAKPHMLEGSEVDVKKAVARDSRNGGGRGRGRGGYNDFRQGSYTRNRSGYDNYSGYDNGGGYGGGGDYGGNDSYGGSGGGGGSSSWNQRGSGGGYGDYQQSYRDYNQSSFGSYQQQGYDGGPVRGSSGQNYRNSQPYSRY